MAIDIHFYAQNAEGIDTELIIVRSDHIPRVGELVIFRETENDNDVFGDYRVAEVAYRYFLPKEDDNEPEFVIVSLKSDDSEEPTNS